MWSNHTSDVNKEWLKTIDYDKTPFIQKGKIFKKIFYIIYFYKTAKIQNNSIETNLLAFTTIL